MLGKPASSPLWPALPETEAALRDALAGLGLIPAR